MYFFPVLEMEPRASHMLDEGLTTEPYPSPGPVSMKGELAVGYESAEVGEGKSVLKDSPSFESLLFSCLVVVT
jgi:hypothetical protein